MRGAFRDCSMFLSDRVYGSDRLTRGVDRSKIVHQVPGHVFPINSAAAYESKETSTAGNGFLYSEARAQIAVPSLSTLGSPASVRTGSRSFDTCRVEEPPYMLVPILPVTGQATSIDNPFMIRNLQLGLFFESLRLSLKPFTESFQKSSVLSRFRPRHIRDKGGRASLLCEQGYIRVFVNLSLLPEPFQHRDVIVSFELSFLVVYLCPAPS